MQSQLRDESLERNSRDNISVMVTVCIQIDEFCI